MKTFSSILEPLFYISLGGMAYYFLEIACRGRSHYSMILCGGLAFYCVSLMNRCLEDKLSLLSRMILASAVITIIELFFGLYFNLYLHKNVWDYSTHFINYKGQICLSFSVIWFFLSFPIFYIDRKLKIFLFSPAS